MSKLMTVLVVLLSLAVAGLFLVKHENASLRTSLDRANSVASGQQTTITMLKNQLHVALTRADKNELAQVALRQELENAAKREALREKTITRLLNENEDFRRWYGADLPDAVRRLHQRHIMTTDEGQKKGFTFYADINNDSSFDISISLMLTERTLVSEVDGALHVKNIPEPTPPEPVTRPVELYINGELVSKRDE